MPGIGVVHLVRKANGIAPLERFIASYRDRPAGCAHELVLVCKGFPGRLPPEYQRVLEGIEHRALHVPDRGFDLAPYFAAVRRLEYRDFCFLNSFSRIVAAGWLELLQRALAAPGVGLVGATASYQSFAQLSEERKGLGMRARLRHVASGATPREKAQRTGAWLLGGLGLWKPARHFPFFPNYHIRTNAFMASREVLLRVRVRPILFKLSAFLLESGRNGLTRQVMAMGLEPLVVDRAGRAFEKERWHLANTFRQARQEDLLVEDNQTEAYARADREGRAALSRAAWGQHARPV
jgi:hypothetical protein